jgi:hypothetical protein
MLDKIALPTVGRIVYFHVADRLEPWPAMVVEVVENQYKIATMHVFLHDGLRVMNDVPHKDNAVNGAFYWDWMPYQKGQAAKTEALQAELDGKLRQSMSAQKPTPNAQALAAEKK